ncbi:MAG TPA: SRPBCC domain-containing protein [Gemmatimonadaceae bacterium]|jgi:uncharacterized protein YndB with AHSA1/START domain|nr:SRPBCC domain-containing protein [Gemmatimonadaceae bacterium]
MIRPLRAVVLEARLDASPAEVWHALTDAEMLADWFPRTATAQQGVGGIVEIAWDGPSWPSTIDVWEPERHLRWANDMPAGPDGQPQPRMLIDWFISSENGQTVLRLVQSGFGPGVEWDGQIEGTEGGWKYFLWNLEQVLTRHRGRRRHLVWTRPRVPATRDAFWKAIFDHGLVSVDGEQCTLTLGTISARGVVAILDPPARFAARFPELEHALLFIELEGSKPGFHAGFWLSTYGLAPDRGAALQEALTHAVQECVRHVTPADTPVEAPTG